MFADLALARRVDRAEASLSADITATLITRASVEGAFVTPFAGGVAVYSGGGSPMTKVIGAGYEGAPAAEAVAAIEAAYFSRGSSVRMEVATLADPAFVQHLTSTGYRLKGFENVLGRALAPGTLDSLVLPPDVTIRPSADHAAWMAAVIDGFESPDTGVVSAPGEAFEREPLERLLADISTARGFTRYDSLIGDALAGGGSLRQFEGIAQLCGAATRPAFRRRGLQTALLHVRLRDAAAAGCDVAVVTTEPGSKSQQNVQRSGFALLYTRAILVKEPPPA
jgi:hypothetical protein